MEKYEIDVYWSEEDSLYLAEVPDLPGCIADGKTRSEALQIAEVIASEWIETARIFGRAVPEPSRRYVETHG